MATKEPQEKVPEPNSQQIPNLEKQLKHLSLRKKSHKNRELKQQSQQTKKPRSTTQELISHKTSKPTPAFKRKKHIKKLQKIDWKYEKIEKKTHQTEENKEQNDNNSAQVLSDIGYERVLELSLKNSKESLNESFGNDENKPRGFSFNEIRDDLLKMKKNEKEKE